MNMHFAQLDPAVFSNPLNFNPYRWIDDESSSERVRMEKYFHPFGKGSRICLGMKYVPFLEIRRLYPCCEDMIRAKLKIFRLTKFSLAYCEMYLAIANVFRKFRFELFETTADDVKIISNALVGHPSTKSKGIRGKVTRRE